MGEASRTLCCLDRTCLPNDIFDSCISTIYKAIDMSQSVMIRPKNSLNGVNVDVDLTTYAGISSKAVELALLTIQKIHKSSSLMKSTEEDFTPDLPLWEIHNRFCREAKDFRFNETI